MGQNHIFIRAVWYSLFRVGQNHIFIPAYSVHTVFSAGKSPYIRSYTVCIYGSGQFKPVWWSGDPRRRRVSVSFLCVLKFREAEVKGPGAHNTVQVHTVQVYTTQWRFSRGGHLRPQTSVVLKRQLSMVTGTGNSQAQYPEVADST